MPEVFKAFDEARKWISEQEAADDKDEDLKRFGLAVCTIVESIAVSLGRIADAAAGPINGFNSEARRDRVQEGLRRMPTRPAYDPDVPF